jgi:hypothetical protein
MNEMHRVPNWRIVLAALLDFSTVNFAAGFLIASFWGTTAAGPGTARFSLTGAPALIALGIVICYFLIFNRYAGGTIWKHILRVPVGPLMFSGRR